ELGRDALPTETRPDGPLQVAFVPDKGDLLPAGLAGPRLQTVAAAEVVIEGDEPSVADVIWAHVVVGDVERVEAPSQRTHRRAARPLATGGPGLTAVAGGNQRRLPTRLKVCLGVGPGPNPVRIEVVAGLEDRAEHGIGMLPRAEQLESCLGCHPVSQCPH